MEFPQKDMTAVARRFTKENYYMHMKNGGNILRLRRLHQETKDRQEGTWLTYNWASVLKLPTSGRGVSPGDHAVMSGPPGEEQETSDGGRGCDGGGLLASSFSPGSGSSIRGVHLTPMVTPFYPLSDIFPLGSPLKRGHLPDLGPLALLVVLGPSAVAGALCTLKVAAVAAALGPPVRVAQASVRDPQQQV
ncbi:UNVERIFIED_CONTAM: hypothetical protein FKN15_032250 [Acipenser sinensis]